jgi:hypothetical protein
MNLDFCNAENICIQTLICSYCQEFVLVGIKDKRYEAVCLCLCNAGVVTSCYVPVEGQCTVNIQRSMLGMCAVSGTDA